MLILPKDPLRRTPLGVGLGGDEVLCQLCIDETATTRINTLIFRLPIYSVSDTMTIDGTDELHDSLSHPEAAPVTDEVVLSQPIFSQHTTGDQSLRRGDVFT